MPAEGLRNLSVGAYASAPKNDPKALPDEHPQRAGKNPSRLRRSLLLFELAFKPTEPRSNVDPAARYPAQQELMGVDNKSRSSVDTAAPLPYTTRTYGYGRHIPTDVDSAAPLPHTTRIRRRVRKCAQHKSAEGASPIYTQVQNAQDPAAPPHSKHPHPKM